MSLGSYPKIYPANETMILNAKVCPTGKEASSTSSRGYSSKQTMKINPTARSSPVAAVMDFVF